MLQVWNKGRGSKQMQDWSEYTTTPTATIETVKLHLSQIIAFTGTFKLTSDELKVTENYKVFWIQRVLPLRPYPSGKVVMKLNYEWMNEKAMQSHQTSPARTSKKGINQLKKTTWKKRQDRVPSLHLMYFVAFCCVKNEFVPLMLMPEKQHISTEPWLQKIS